MLFSFDESGNESEITEFDHDTSYEEDEQEEIDGKTDDSGENMTKKNDNEQVNNEKKWIMLKLFKDNLLGIMLLLLENAMLTKLKQLFQKT